MTGVTKHAGATPPCHAELAGAPAGIAAQSKRARRLKRAIVASAIIHLSLLVLFFAFYKPFTPPPPVKIVFGHVTIERRISQPPPPPAAKKQAVQPAPAHAAVAQAAPPAARPRVEIAHITPHAKTYQPKDTHSHVAVQAPLPQVDYSKTIAKLRAANDPVAAAQSAVNVGANTHNYSSDFSTSIGTVGSGNGYLEPVRSWHDSGYDYYYVHYEVEYPDGTTESGIVPWPIRYLPQADPFRLGIHHMPLPGPLPDFVVTADTVFHPLTKYCYEHRDELSDCPIAHD